tara:strand:+ start:356 stop:631 length:276 start_codon:yes stop_codon:yes gene_type:complete
MNRSNSFCKNRNTNARIEDTVIDMDKTVMLDKLNIYNNLYNKNVQDLKDIKNTKNNQEIEEDKDNVYNLIYNIKKYKRLREEMLKKIKDSK